MLRFAQIFFRRAPSPPRQFKTRPPDRVLPTKDKIEEEAYEWFAAEKFYPVRPWQVINNKYQVIGKLGYGSRSTVWLCRDLINHSFVSMKIAGLNSVQAAKERTIYQHLKSIPTRHEGSQVIRALLDTFEIQADNGVYICLVHEVLGISLARFQKIFPENKIPSAVLKLTLVYLLFGLDYLHTECRMIHTDIKASNILLAIDDASVLTEFAEAEVSDPSPYKVHGENRVYVTRQLRTRGSVGKPILCDFGEARIGTGNFHDDIQPFEYRAPEIILGKTWDNKVDIWNFGVLAWDLAQGQRLFIARDGNERQSNVRHMAELTAILGPPPPSILEHSKIAPKYFNAQGEWINDFRLPSKSLKELDTTFVGKEKALFLQFIRKMLRWIPAERLSAAELLNDPWLNQG